MNQNRKASNASRKSLSGVSILGTDPFPTTIELVSIHPTDSFLRLLVFFLLYFVSVACTYAVTYEAQGTVSYMVFDAAGNSIQNKQRRFDVLISGNLWWIRTEVTRSPQPMSAVEIDALKQKMGIIISPEAKPYAGDEGARIAAECSSDGHSIYIKTVFVKDDKEIEQKRKLDRNYLGQPDEMVIFNHPLPSFNSELYFPVWLAFCSQAFLRQREIYSPPLIWMNFTPRQSSGREFRLLSQLRCQVGDCFIEDIMFENEGFFAGRTNAGDFVIRDLPPNASIPYLEARYHVQQWGKLHDMEYPKLGQFDIYPFGTKTNAPAEVVIRNTVTVESFGISRRRVDGLPIVTNLVRIIDFRNTDNKPLRYLSTNGVAQLGDQRMEQLISKTARSSQLAKDKPNAMRFKKWLVGAMIISISILGSLVWVAARNNKT